ILFDQRFQAVCKASSLCQPGLQCGIQGNVRALDKIDGVGYFLIKAFDRKFVTVGMDVPEYPEGELIPDLGLKIGSAGDPVVLWCSGSSVGDEMQILIAPVI